MRSIQLLAIIFIFSVPLIAQSTFSVEPVEVDTTFDLTMGQGKQDVPAYFHFSQSGSTSTDYVWTRTIITSPDEWQIAVCDINLCYLPHVESQNFTVPAGEEFEFSVHLYPNEIAGDSAIILVTIEEEGNPDNSVDLISRFYAKNVSTSLIPGKDELKLYPNPAKSSFYIHPMPEGGFVSISNMVGQSVKEFSSNSGGTQEKFDVTDLNSGLYFVRIMNKNGATIKTLRLNISR